MDNHYTVEADRYGNLQIVNTEPNEGLTWEEVVNELKKQAADNREVNDL